MKKVISITVAAITACMLTVPAFAFGPVNINQAKQKAGNTITNGSPSASASAGSSAVGVGSVTTTTSAGAVSGSTSGVNSTIKATTTSGPATTVSGPASTNSGSIKNKATGGSVGDVAPYQGTEVHVEGDKAASIPGMAPAIFAPGLAAGAYTCLGAKSGGLSLGVPGGVGVGGTFGSTVESERCNARADAATLTGMGDAEAARARLCQVQAIADAYETAGKPCAPKKVRALAPVVKNHPVAAAALAPDLPAGECKDHELLVTAANGESFCRAN